jgi:hypothetical protein
MRSVENGIFLEVDVDSDDRINESVALRFKVIGRICFFDTLHYDDGEGHVGRWTVVARASATPARTALVEDSSDGASRLFVGDTGGLLLRHVSSGYVRAEPYLLLTHGVEWSEKT